jgi:hypothetical protein
MLYDEMLNELRKILSETYGEVNRKTKRIEALELAIQALIEFGEQSVSEL